MAKRKERIDGKAAAVKVMAAAAKEIHAPSNVPLTDTDKPFFANVIEEFARSDWTAHQLEIAAMIARTMNDINREQQELRKEGYITTRQNGTTVENPRQRVVKSLTGDLLSLRRSLSLHARARGEARDVAKRTGYAKEIEAKREICLNDLIAKPG